MPQLPENYTLHSARGLDALAPRTLHDIARLRQEVFVVEQDCVYLDLDGRDAEAATEQFWIAVSPASPEPSAEHTPHTPRTASTVAATLRVLDESAREPGLHAVGRVVTGVAHRGKALAAALMEEVVAQHGAAPLVLEAQSHLTDWYGRFGFAVSGAEYLEDDIPHTPMRREPSAAA